MADESRAWESQSADSDYESTWHGSGGTCVVPDQGQQGADDPMRMT